MKCLRIAEKDLRLHKETSARPSNENDLVPGRLGTRRSTMRVTGRCRRRIDATTATATTAPVGSHRSSVIAAAVGSNSSAGMGLRQR